jgi:hypothetical protein
LSRSDEGLTFKKNLSVGLGLRNLLYFSISTHGVHMYVAMPFWNVHK